MNNTFIFSARLLLGAGTPLPTSTTAGYHFWRTKTRHEMLAHDRQKRSWR